jgi:hypothetical protein
MLLRVGLFGMFGHWSSPFIDENHIKEKNHLTPLDICRCKVFYAPVEKMGISLHDAEGHREQPQILAAKYPDLTCAKWHKADRP